MRRGDFVTIALQGDLGKPRPALVIQSDNFGAHATVTVLLVSSAMVDAPLLRVTVAADESNGLRKTSQVMVDKAMTVRRDKIGDPIGKATDEVILEVGRCLAVFLGIVR
ncbi:type II toxin-antitoxin system PemK/MazF family toxin [Pandoraea sp.]|uniref:type II toxin-antitoxin system PemK/MazF family toxin n=1 Tax=Pandoraea sp. TaxID=1883445 RepID=UPI001210696A|nr:type II toxin-antitoxin system PemK/MazF family toxin [Pandoraea sp.]TAL52754.1 MAG: type II toxin-antitoxin system PemK/MazF family toxin [Pandoraea sp.]TAM17724.1 MAG: type II toxin-antitoxin system PemK/MazF family toxin [Pandoraea sp.]